jgi:hypothetical protein
MLRENKLIYLIFSINNYLTNKTIFLFKRKIFRRVLISLEENCFITFL